MSMRKTKRLAACAGLAGFLMVPAMSLAEELSPEEEGLHVCEEHLGEQSDVLTILVGTLAPLPEIFDVAVPTLQDAIDTYANDAFPEGEFVHGSTSDGVCIAVESRVLPESGALINTEDFDKPGNVVIFGLQAALVETSPDWPDGGELSGWFRFDQEFTLESVVGPITISNDEPLENIVITRLTIDATVPSENGATAGISGAVTSGVFSNNILQIPEFEEPVEPTVIDVEPLETGIALEPGSAETIDWALTGNYVAGFSTSGITLEAAGDGEVEMFQNRLTDNAVAVSLVAASPAGSEVSMGLNMIDANATGVVIDGAPAQLFSNFILGSDTGVQVDALADGPESLGMVLNFIGNNDVGLSTTEPVDARVNAWVGPDLSGFANLPVFSGFVPSDDSLQDQPDGVSEDGVIGEANYGPLDAEGVALGDLALYDNVEGQGDSVAAGVRYWPWIVPDANDECGPTEENVVEFLESLAIVDVGDLDLDNNGQETTNGVGLPLTCLVPVSPRIDGDDDPAFVGNPEQRTVYPSQVGTAQTLEVTETPDEVDQIEFGYVEPVTQVGIEALTADTLMTPDVSDYRKSVVLAAYAFVADFTVVKSGSATSQFEITPMSGTVDNPPQNVEFEFHVGMRRLRPLLEVQQVTVNGDVLPSDHDCVGKGHGESCEVEISEPDTLVDFQIGS